MRCPFCGLASDKVNDSRANKDGNVIRRRRECLTCARRFTTYEYIEEILPQVVKRNLSREPFIRDKVREGIRRACWKRPVDTTQIEGLIDRLEKKLAEYSEKEIGSETLGSMVLTELWQVDAVAGMRFASVYLKYETPADFIRQLESLDVFKQSIRQPDANG